MTVDGIIGLVKKLVDVMLVWMIFYYILKNLRKNVKMVLLFKGILVIVVLKIISDIFAAKLCGFDLRDLIQKCYPSMINKYDKI